MTDYSAIHIVKDFPVNLSFKDNEQANKEVYVHAEALCNKIGQSGDHYARKRKANPDKVIKDIALGKKSEIMAMHLLRDEFGFPEVPIDIEIREANNKGWMPDLYYRKVDPSICNVHVKGCNGFTVTLCNDYSWTFQWKNSDAIGGKDEIFRSGSGDLCAFVFMEDWQNDTGTVKAILPWDYVCPLFRDPVLTKYIGIKHCLYYRDFQNN